MLGSGFFGIKKPRPKFRSGVALCYFDPATRGRNHLGLLTPRDSSPVPQMGQVRNDSFSEADVAARNEPALGHQLVVEDAEANAEQPAEDYGQQLLGRSLG